MGMNIAEDMRRALKSGDKDKLSVLRLMHAAIQQKEIDMRRKLSEPERRRALERMAKQRQESISQFAAAGRQDLVDKESHELAVIRSYLPRPLDEKTLGALVEKTIGDVGASGIKDMGKVMRALQEKAAGRADMGRLSQSVREKLMAMGA